MELNTDNQFPVTGLGYHGHESDVCYITWDVASKVKGCLVLWMVDVVDSEPTC